MYYKFELTMYYRLELTMYYYSLWYDKLWGPSQRVVTLFDFSGVKNLNHFQQYRYQCQFWTPFWHFLVYSYITLPTSHFCLIFLSDLQHLVLN